jgi:uncharacterized protein YndB with AHSA1/START domain
MANEKTTITIETTVGAPVEKVWKIWNDPQDITRWNTATPEWHTPRAEHELKPGGKFNFRMEAKDGSMGFDFGGVYDVVKPNEKIAYTMGDGRKVQIDFHTHGDHTHIIQKFEAETQNSVEMQRQGWQNILDNFKKFAETH